MGDLKVVRGHVDDIASTMRAASRAFDEHGGTKGSGSFGAAEVESAWSTAARAQDDMVDWLVNSSATLAAFAHDSSVTLTNADAALSRELGK
jgi:hypothetical protein